MNRRTFLRNATGLTYLLAALTGPRATADQESPSLARPEYISAWRRRINSILDRGRLPIIDMEATYIEGTTSLSRMIDYMNTLDVAQIAFAAANAQTSQPSLDLYLKYPEYFIPTTNSGEFPRWWRDPAAFLDGIGNDLKSGDYVLMGEHEFRHYPSPEQVHANNRSRDISIDIGGPAGQALFSISEESGVAFQIHYEIEDALLGPLETMLERYPRAKVIWCHLGMIRYPNRASRYSPQYVDQLIGRFPGLHFDLAVPGPGNVYRPSGAEDSTIYKNGQLADAWKALLEKHPDRFIAASDYRPPVEQDYPQLIGRQRSLILDALSEPTQHQIAYGNAWRLITGRSWQR